MDNDFSTNWHSSALSASTGLSDEKPCAPSRHPDIYFNDGNVAIVANHVYFLVHKGLLCRRSQVLGKRLECLDKSSCTAVEGRPILLLEDSTEDMAIFLRAIYDGISDLSYDAGNFLAVSGLLRLSNKYQVKSLHSDVLRGLSLSWPSTLSLWDLREAASVDASGTYAPRRVFPHPILIINLARGINAPQLLPSAFYDLSRSLPSDTTLGYKDDKGVIHRLAPCDLLSLLKGREHASRFLSTFIVNELEGRLPALSCLRRNEEATSNRRSCPSAFEAITFALLCDVNGIARNWSFDPLNVILETEFMHTRGSRSETDHHRACVYCQSEFSTVANAAREQLWHSLPIWFDVEPPNWG